MDTLFTTFVSPGMVSPYQPLEGSTLLENCLVELDLTNSSSNKDMTMKYPLNVSGGDHLAKELSKGEGCSDCCDQINGMFILPPFVMEFQKNPSRYQSSPSGCKREVSNVLFSEYFRHQMHHIAVNRRMQTSLQAIFDCCLQVGTSVCRHVEKGNHCCCKIEDSIMASYQSMINTEACPCDKKEKGDRRCQIHDLLIKDMEISEGSCTWTIYFSAAAVNVPDNSDQCFVNPCYDELCENLLDDSFEIEFTTTTANEMESSFDTFDFTNIHFACDMFGGSGDEFFDVYDYDEDDGDTLIYESSDDEEDCCEMFNSGVIISSTWNSDTIISHTNMYQSKMATKKALISSALSHRGKKVSKYHTKCTTYSCNYTVAVDNNNKTGSVNMVDDKLKKKVNFPESDRLVTVHPLVAWAHAYKESRKSMWSIVAQDRAHFRRRIMNTSAIIEPVLKQKLSRLYGNT